MSATAIHLATPHSSAYHKRSAASAGPRYTIGDMAREFGVTLRTLRFYEDRGLIRPERRGLTRLYTEGERERVRLILLYRRIGLTLSEIKRLMEFEAVEGDTPRQLETSLSIFQRQANALRVERETIEETLNQLGTLIENVTQRLAKAS